MNAIPSSVILFAAGLMLSPAAAQDSSSAPLGEKQIAAAAPAKEAAVKTPTAPPFVAPKSEADFISSAVKSGTTAVKLADLALTRSVNEKVKGFAQTVLDDQKATNSELKAVAGDAGVPADTADPKRKERVDELTKKSGKEFDEAFLEEMAACHANDLALFDAGKKVAASPKVTAFIEKTLPVIQRRAEKINLMAPGAHEPEGKSAPPKQPEAVPGTKPVSATVN